MHNMIKKNIFSFKSHKNTKFNKTVEGFNEVGEGVQISRTLFHKYTTEIRPSKLFFIDNFFHFDMFCLNDH